ncbi:MAG: ribokinase, partial [Armatimonadetes bacterium]|nr:ribokinase [Armatimonadota bacterium]
EVTFVARVGPDAFGTHTLEHLQREGVNTDYVKRDREAAHGVALILVDPQGENLIAVAPGANARLSAEDVDRAEPAIAACDGLVLQLETPLPAVERAVELARKHERPVLLNPAPACPLPSSLLARVDYLTPNETELEQLLGGGPAGLGGVAETAGRLLAAGVGCVIVTLGKEGVYVVSPNESYHVPGRRVTVVDTTAAGDAFSGALATWLAEGYGFREAVQRAVAAAALSVSRAGAQSSLPYRRDVEALLDS